MKIYQVINTAMKLQMQEETCLNLKKAKVEKVKFEEQYSCEARNCRNNMIYVWLVKI